MPKAVLKIDEFELEIGHKALLCLLNHLGNSPEEYGENQYWQSIMIHLSSDPDYGIRKTIAAMFDLPLEARVNLLSDTNPEVVCEYLESGNSVSSIHPNWVSEWLNLPGLQVQKALAWQLSNLEPNLQKQVMDTLVVSPSAEIRAILAEDPDTPLLTLRQLSSDADPEVSRLARMTVRDLVDRSDPYLTNEWDED